MKDSRLSHAYPPETKTNNTYIAKVHNILPKMTSEIRLEDIKFRSIKYDWEIDEIRALHKEWFPIDYSKEFFESIKTNKTKCLIAIYEAEIKYEKHTLILGVITYDIRKINYKLINFSCKDIFQSKLSIYILTLGAINEIRKIGLATKLIDKLIDLTKQYHKIKYIYLHVIEYNDHAIRFYEKNNFKRVETKYNHYFIGGKIYNGYAYAYYTNGGRYTEVLKDLKSIFSNFLIYINIPRKILNCCRYSYERFNEVFKPNSRLAYKETKSEE